jgi:uracil-DNA glycosylase
MLNANQGGTPDNYRIVNVRQGEHEYIEGRNSSPTTRNGADMLLHIAGSADPESLRPMQVLNRFFRRSPQRPNKRQECAHMDEARPFLEELIQYVQPEAIIFGGDAGVRLFAEAHRGTVKSGATIMGPNGTADAVYFREYEMKLPYFRPIAAYGIYHPSKLNQRFRDAVYPVLRERLGPLMPSESS